MKFYLYFFFRLQLKMRTSEKFIYFPMKKQEIFSFINLTSICYLFLKWNVLGKSSIGRRSLKLPLIRKIISNSIDFWFGQCRLAVASRCPSLLQFSFTFRVNRNSTDKIYVNELHQKSPEPNQRTTHMQLSWCSENKKGKIDAARGCNFSVNHCGLMLAFSQSTEGKIV